MGETVPLWLKRPKISQVVVKGVWLTGISVFPQKETITSELTAKKLQKSYLFDQYEYCKSRHLLLQMAGGGDGTQEKWNSLQMEQRTEAWSVICKCTKQNNICCGFLKVRLIFYAAHSAITHNRKMALRNDDTRTACHGKKSFSDIQGCSRGIRDVVEVGLI